MTSMLSRGRHTRTAVTAGAACLALVALSACEKPTPMTTLTVGSDSVHTEAACYNDGKKLGDEDLGRCLQEGGGEVPTITVDQGSTLGMGVEPETAERGWQVWLEGQQPILDFKDSTYETIEIRPLLNALGQMTGEPPEELNLAIVEAGSINDPQAGSYGVWQYKLKVK
ncbi:DUF2771 domain-containing protein [Streptomyces sp. JJ66]|uniref:DUF2771 domain-containing protein n=1 Tax=Streptomyces sp. JJ66 TaxID=2803843 RepID=UPI001C55F9BC|nr:DUF2771 domain-containing protein [Streptomyces sp. JJ66]MBW1603762.1 DUF2771 domain-containing protein [Streptomyces sp. JJ66]